MILFSLVYLFVTLSWLDFERIFLLSRSHFQNEAAFKQTIFVWLPRDKKISILNISRTFTFGFSSFNALTYLPPSVYSLYPYKQWDDGTLKQIIKL